MALCKNEHNRKKGSANTVTKIEEQILEEYIADYESEAASYRLLGKMLNEEFVYKRLKMFDIQEMYIYGGTYLAAQLYKIAGKYVHVKGIIDKSRKNIVNDDVPIFDIEELRDRYMGEKIIITLIRYYKEIEESLLEFADIDNLFNIGELMEGCADKIV